MCIYRMLEAVCDLAPDIYPLVYSAYSSPSTLPWGGHAIQSSEGVQQGDPLGPLLFCLTFHRHCVQLCSPLTVIYLDDVSLCGLMSMEYVELLKLHHLLTCPPLQPWQT